MLNANSPIVQQMINNTPPGQGNFPMEFYQGSRPTITTETAPMMQSPYPSPMEMSMSIPQPMGMYGNQFVAPQPQPYFMNGYYNPFFNPALSQPNYWFNNRFDPNVFGQFGYSQMNSGYNPNNDNCKIIMDSAIQNGISYQDQLKNESTILKAVSRAVSKSRGLSEEEIEKSQKAFDIKSIDPPKYQDPYSRGYVDTIEEKVLEVSLVRGSETICTSGKTDKHKIARKLSMCLNDSRKCLNDEQRIAVNRINRIYYSNYLYDNSVNRKADNMSLFEILNSFSGVWNAMDADERIREAQRKNIGLLYNRDEFRRFQQKLAKANNYGGYFGTFTHQIDASISNDMIRGGYGYLPGGIPSTPGREWTGPGIGLDNMGRVSMECPQFMRDYFERERQNTASLKNKAQARIDYLRDRFKQTCQAVSEREKMAGNG